MGTVVQERLINLAEAGDVVFFVGSGISAQYPSCLPTAFELVQISAAIALPGFTRDVRRIAGQIQPEVFYQELTALLGARAFTALSLLADPGPPTLAHLLIARWAMRSSLPIITTNFDVLLESAIRSIGGSAHVVVPTQDWTRPPGVISVWKPHGSIEFGPQEVYATMSRITQPDFSLLREIAALARDKHMCFVGYSGRDIDLFPLIASQSDIKQPFWIDPRFGEPHPDPWTEELQERAKRIDAACTACSLDEIARTYLPSVVNSLPYAQSLLSRLEAQELRSREIERKVDGFRDRYEDDITLSPAEQEFFLAKCYLRTGHPRRAQRILALGQAVNAEDEFLQAQAYLLSARLLDSLSDYIRSEDEALAAVKVTRDLVWVWPPDIKAIALRVQALHAYAMARKMQIGPSIEYGTPELSYRPEWRAGLKVLLLYSLLLARMRVLLLLPVLISGRFSRLRSPTAEEDVWLLEAWTWYFDHVIVFLGFLQKLLRPIWLRRALTRFALSRLRNAALRAGDSFAVANTEKELKRLGLRVSDENLAALKIYELITNPLNKALLHRNEAEDFLRHGEVQSAAEEFEACFREARRCGSYATMLKAVAGLKTCGARISNRIILVLECRISGQGYQDYISKLKRLVGT